MSRSQPIIIVEDSDDDYEATERALKKDGRLVNPLIRFENSEDAIRYLDEVPASQSSGRFPGIVLLDLNMPGAGGYAVLTRIKSDPNLKLIPVVVMTTSSDPADIKKCYAAGANTFISKPVALERFFTAVQQLRDYWIELAILPEAPS